MTQPLMADLIPVAKKQAEKSEAYKNGSKYERSKMESKKQHGGSKKK